MAPSALRIESLTAGILLLLAAAGAYAQPEDDIRRRAREEVERQLQSLVPTPPTKVRIDYVGLDDPTYKLEEAVFELDGNLLVSSPFETFGAEGVHRVWNGDVAPGKHSVRARVVYASSASVVMSDEGGYRWTLAGEVSFEVFAGIEVQVKVVPRREGAQSEVAKRFRLQLPAAPVMLARLDDGKVPELSATVAKRAGQPAPARSALRSDAIAEEVPAPSPGSAKPAGDGPDTPASASPASTRGAASATATATGERPGIEGEGNVVVAAAARGTAEDPTSSPARAAAPERGGGSGRDVAGAGSPQAPEGRPAPDVAARARRPIAPTETPAERPLDQGQAGAEKLVAAAPAAPAPVPEPAAPPPTEQPAPPAPQPPPSEPEPAAPSSPPQRYVEEPSEQVQVWKWLAAGAAVLLVAVFFIFRKKGGDSNPPPQA